MIDQERVYNELRFIETNRIYIIFTECVRKVKEKFNNM